MDDRGERDRRLRGGSNGEGDADRGRLKRKGLVGLEEYGAAVEASSGTEAMAMSGLVDSLLQIYLLPVLVLRNKCSCKCKGK